jgi:hypothetical protein
MCQPIGRKGLKSKGDSAYTTDLQKSFSNSKALGKKQPRTDKFIKY